MPQEGQNPDYAYTVNGDAYELESEYKYGPIPYVVTAYSPSSTILSVVDLEECPVSFNARAEAEEPGNGCSKFLIIGIYALIEQDENTGLCYAFQINQEQAFYVSEYRTNTTSKTSRKSQ